jgi:hypothetical protein
MAPTNSPGTITQNGKQITQQPLPDIIRAKYRTKTTSTSAYTFEGEYLPWEGFEKEVRENFRRHKFGSSIISVRRVLPDQFDIVNEMFHCGDELSLSGRFVQQVLHVMTAVGRDSNVQIRFGDYKTVYTAKREERRLEEERRAGITSQPKPKSQPGDPQLRKDDSRKDPDFAAVNYHNDRIRFAGEIKTPWTQNFEETQALETRWRRWLGKWSFSCVAHSDLCKGQIANYMKIYNLKYGFWTTYEQTIFLKQEKSQQGEWMLRLSAIIKHDTKSDLTVAANSNLRGCVSLRECMLFLMCKANGPDTDVYVQNDNKHFTRKDGDSLKVSDPDLAQQAARKLGKQARPSQEETEALIKAEQEGKSRSRDERALRRQMRPQASGRPLGSLEETSREPHARQLFPPSQASKRLGRDPSTSSSRSSSVVNKQRVQQPTGQEQSRSRSASAERGRTTRYDPSEESPGQAARQRSKSAKGVPSAESQGKQRAKSSSASRERRAQMAPPPARDPGPPRERSGSSHRRIGPPTDQDEEEYDDDDDLYENPDPERRPTRTIPIRTSREAPPPLPNVPPQPRAPGESLPRQAQASMQVATSTGPATATAGSAQAGGGGPRSPFKGTIDTVRSKMRFGKDKKDKKDADKENKKGRKK